MSVAASQAVTIEKIGGHIAIVTINRPEARNAVNGAVAQGLERAVRDTEADDDVWCVILTGAGDQAFCAGADLKEVAAGRREGISTEAGGFGGFVHMPRSKVWIAAVNGFALAGGLEIMLACDMAVASEKAAFGLPEVMRGLVALAGGIYRLPRAIPRNVAMELIATGGRLEAKRAGDLGLVNYVVPHEQLRDAAVKLAATICANAPVAVRESLSVARRAFDCPDAELRKLAEEAAERNAQTADFREGRWPSWRSGRRAGRGAEAPATDGDGRAMLGPGRGGAPSWRQVERPARYVQASDGSRCAGRRASLSDPLLYRPATQNADYQNQGGPDETP